MHDFNFEMNQYLTYCRTQKRLDGKTLKAYRIDLTQFGVSLAAAFPSLSSISELSPAILESYIATLHEQFKPKTVKRKLASSKPFSTTSTTATALSPILSTNCISNSGNR